MSFWITPCESELGVGTTWTIIPAPCWLLKWPERFLQAPLQLKALLVFSSEATASLVQQLGQLPHSPHHTLFSAFFFFLLESKLCWYVPEMGTGKQIPEPTSPLKRMLLNQEAASALSVPGEMANA